MQGPSVVMLIGKLDLIACINPFVLMVECRKARSEMETDGDEGDGGEGDEGEVETEPKGDGEVTNEIVPNLGDGGKDLEAFNNVAGVRDQCGIDEGESEVEDK